MNKNQWIDRGLLDAFEAECTDAHRLCTADNGWVERFGRDILISFRTTAARERSIAGLKEWAKSVDFPISRVFARFLPKKNEERETPKVIIGDEGENLQTIATEHHLKFGIDFGAWFSVAAASAGAQTVNVDLSKKSLERGRQNFVLNSLSTEGHKFIVDDVRPVL